MIGGITAVAFQSDGDIVLGGTFTSIGGVARQGLARLDVDGNVDVEFAPTVIHARAGETGVTALAVQADGKILVGGRFDTLGGQSRDGFGRLNPDGSVDLDFNPGVNIRLDSGVVRALAVQADGKVLVAGYFSSVAGQSRNHIGRLHADGGVDLDFNPDANGIVNTMALQADGKIVVGGDFTTLGGQSRSRIGRLNADGAVDMDFNPGANRTVNTIVIQRDGKISIGGDFTTLGGQSRNGIGRLHPDGSVDIDFNPGATAPATWRDRAAVNALALQADGKILVGGRFTTLGGVSTFHLGRLHTDGSFDSTFTAWASDTVSWLAVQGDGKILVGGHFSTLSGVHRWAFGRMNNTDEVVETLGYDGAALTWLRDGSGPEFWSTTFAYSSDGIAWTDLGVGGRIPGGWRIAGASLPADSVIVARGWVSGGYLNGSTWFVETTAPIMDIWREGPDLLVASLEAPTTAMAGSTQPLAWTIANQGTQTVTGDWVDRIYLSPSHEPSDGLLLGEFPAGGPLAVDESRQRTHSVILPEDLLPEVDYWWIVVTDANNDVQEQHEGNNVRISDNPLRVERAPAPNLEVVAVEVSSPRISTQPVTITWVVRNTGTASTGDELWQDAVHLSADSELDENDPLLGRVSRPHPLGVEETYQSSLTATLPEDISGPWFVLVSTDVDNQINEDPVEQDNTIGIEVEVLALTPPQITQQPASQTVQSGNPATLTVEASGTEPLTYQWYAGASGDISHPLAVAAQEK